MGKRLFILIGGIGTGAAALQKYFARHRAGLEKRGFMYPGPLVRRGGHRTAGQYLGATEIPRPARTQLKEMIRGVQGRRWQTGIITLTSVPGDGMAADFREFLPADWTVSVVYYAGRQDELLEAWYRHLVESPEYRYAGMLDNGLADRLAGLFDHAAVLRPWAEAFGQENVIVRCCDDGLGPAGIRQDFCRIIGLDPTCPAGDHGEGYNPVLGVCQIEFLRLCNSRLNDNRAVHRFLLGRFRNSRLLRNQAGRRLISPEFRRNFLARYEQSDRNTACTYLDRENGLLFQEPLPDPDEPRVPFTGLSAEDLVPIITELIYEQAKWEQPGQPLKTFYDVANVVLRKLPCLSFRDKRSPVSDSRIPMDSLNTGPERTVPAGGEIPCSLHQTAEELVPAVAMSIYRRSGRLPEREPLASVQVLVNHLLLTIAGLSPRWKQEQIRRRLEQMLSGERFSYG